MESSLGLTDPLRLICQDISAKQDAWSRARGPTCQDISAKQDAWSRARGPTLLKCKYLPSPVDIQYSNG